MDLPKLGLDWYWFMSAHFSLRASAQSAIATASIPGLVVHAFEIQGFLQHFGIVDCDLVLSLAPRLTRCHTRSLTRRRHPPGSPVTSTSTVYSSCSPASVLTRSV